MFLKTAPAAAAVFQRRRIESLVELNQSMVALTNMAVTQDNLAKKVARLKALRPSPYFGRIDFLFDGEKKPEPLYIGRTALLEEGTAENLIIDWRSPIASVFYRFLLGDAYYDAPAGRIKGKVTRKRQYEITESQLQYFFDTDMTVSDGILKALLSQNTNADKMRRHCGNDQRDQDLIIRNLDADLLMIQGVARQWKNRDRPATAQLFLCTKGWRTSWPRRTSSSSHQTVPSRATSQVSCQSWARIMCAR